MKRIKFGTCNKTQAYLNFHGIIIAYRFTLRNCNVVSDIRWSDPLVCPVQGYDHNGSCKTKVKPITSNTKIKACITFMRHHNLSPYVSYIIKNISIHQAIYFISPQFFFSLTVSLFTLAGSLQLHAGPASHHSFLSGLFSFEYFHLLTV